MLLFLALIAAGALHAQIGANHQHPSGADRETRAERRDQGCRAPAGYARDASGRSGRRAGRLGARQLRPRSSGRPPVRQRLARLPVPARSATTSPRCTRTSARPFRWRSTTGWRAGSSGSRSTRNSRGTDCSTRCTPSAGRAIPKTPNFIPPGFTPADVTYHNIITEWHATNPAAEHLRGHAARAAARGAHRRQPHPPDGRGRVQPDGEARRCPITACSTRAAAITGFSNGGGPNANNPGQTQRLDSIMTAILRIDPRSPSVPAA